MITGFLLGIVGSLIASAIFVFFAEPMRCSLSYGFPPIAGKYLTYYQDYPEWESEPVNVNQIGFYIYGDFIEPETKESFKFSGNVTASRIITYQFRPKNRRLNDFGCGMIKLNKQGDGGDGYVVNLADDSEMPTTIRISIKRIA